MNLSGLLRRGGQVVAALLLVLLAAGPSQAISFLWETEGSYVHQMSHLLFLLATLFLLKEIHSGGLRGRPAFRSLVWACIFFIWWNLDAVIGHTLDWSFALPIIWGTGLDRWLIMDSWLAWAYYFTRITHFLLPLPAFYLVYRALQAFLRETERKFQ
jgi:hypothetical protein